MKTCIFALALIALSVAPASAQSSTRLDDRWTPWLGCWRLSQDTTSSALSSTLPGMTVCVKPSDTNAGVTMTTFAEGKQIFEQTVLADGVGHPVTDAGCQGMQMSSWSRDGQRLFTTVDVACNAQPGRKVSGITLFAKGPVWVDVQAVEADGDQHVRVRRYERTADAQALASSVTPMSVEDITEASAKVASPALEAALAETGARFNLNSTVLKQLANAGVAPSVIDLMVAQSFPARFRVDRPTALPPQPTAASVTVAPYLVVPYGPYASYAPYGVYDPYAYYPYAYYPYYYYSPFAYPHYWGNNYYRGSTYYITNGNSTVIVPGRSGSRGGTAVEAGTHSGQGQVINGRGYTQVRRGAAPDASPEPAKPTGTSPKPKPAQSSDGGGSGGTRRTAQPR